MNASEPSRARKISAEIWESHQDIIQELRQTKKLEGEDGIIAFMIQKHEFKASKSQYETQFNKWGLRKYLKRKELHETLSIVDDRERQGKRSKALVGGIFRSTEQLDRERARHRSSLARRATTIGPESTTAQLSGAVVVYTPPASPNVYDQVSMQAITPQELSHNQHSEAATVTSSFQHNRLANQHTFRIPSTGHEPFSWMSSLDWKLLKNMTKNSQSLMKRFDAKGSIDEALFHQAQQIARFSEEPEVDVMFAKHLVTLALNDIKHSSQVDLEKVHEWLRQLPHPIILQFFKTLPSGQSHILQERVFVSALEAKDEITVKLIIRSGFDLTQKIQINGSAYPPALPLCKALGSEAYSVARVIVELLCGSHAVHSSEYLDHQLHQIFTFSTLTTNINIDPWCNIVQVLLEAGATPTNNSVKSGLATRSPQILGPLLQRCRDSVVDYIRENILQDCFSDSEWFCRPILVYFLPKEVDRIHKRPATKHALWEAMKLALKEESAWAVDLILEAASFLDIDLGDPKWDATTRNIFLTACRKRSWTLLKKLLFDLLFPAKSDFMEAFDSALEAAKEARHTDLSKPAPINHDLVERISADDFFGEYDEKDIHNMMFRAESSGCDELVIALFSHLTLVDLVSNPIIALLAKVKVATIAQIIAQNPGCMAALVAFSDCGNSGPLEDLLFREFPFAHHHTPRQVAMRCLAYFAINNRNFYLLEWILQSGLFACAIRVRTTHDYPCFAVLAKGLYWRDEIIVSFNICSLLDVAVCQHDRPMIKFFQDHGTKSRWSSSLMIAVLASADEAFLESLLLPLESEKGNFERNYGSSALRAAIFRKDYRMLQYLASRVDINGIEDLLVQGWEADSISKCCLSPLGDAILRQNDKAAEILLENHADLNGLISYDKYHHTKPYNEKGSILCRMSPLLAAVDMEDLHIIRLLVRHGAEVDHAPRLGLMRTPIQRAAEIGNFEIVQYLLTHGTSADATPCRNGGTALQLAALQGHVGIASLLIEHGADVNHLPAEGDGRTALEGATEWSRPDMMSLLVSKGVNFDLVVDSEGSTQYERGLKFAERNGRPASKRFLEGLRKESDVLAFHFELMDQKKDMQ
ncbi:hypothetical protein IQ07DRAFT_590526 [Pyrenochaeta sp. DS3sAY3a]|nr:hypothetical protein IQ07DRAFT_590526 [Pyrenochaeta sp. DS3sAY3a]